MERLVECISFFGVISRSQIVKKYSVINIVLHIFALSLAWFYGEKAGMEFFLTLSVISLIMNEGLIVYACCQGANKVTMLSIVGLNLIGILIQSVFGLESAAKMYIIFLFVGAATVAYAFITRKLKFSNGMFTLLTMLASLGLFVLCCFLPKVNGARNWIEIGGISLQVTEIAKFFAVLFLGTLYLTKAPEWVKFFSALFFIGVCAALLIIRINELGTLLVIGCVFFCSVCMYSQNKIYKKLLTFLLILGIVTFGGLYSSVNKVCYKWECPSGCKVKIKNEDGKEVEKLKVLYGTIICDSCGVGKLQETPVYMCPLCKFRKYTPLPENVKAEDYKCEMCSEHWLLGSKYGTTVEKLYSRFSVWLNYGVVKIEDSAYQTNQSVKSALLGGFFGDRENDVFIPNMKNDSVIAGALKYMGFSCVAVILLLFYMLFLGIRNARSPVKAMAILAICFQAMFAIMGNLNMFALTGIGVPMISSGGSTYLVSFLLCYIILTADNRSVERR